MKKVNGFYLPDDEEHLLTFLEGPRAQMFDGKPCYQLYKYQRCLPFVRQRRHAVDIGGHCGLWSWPMSHDFSLTTAFEPVPRHFECFKANIPSILGISKKIPAGVHPVKLHEVALGDEVGELRIYSVPTSSGGSYACDDGTNVAPLHRLDDYDLRGVDFVKIDCEGYEYFILRGGEETIRREKPAIIVEQKPGNAEKYGIRQDEACRLLISWGAKQRFESKGDYCFSW